MIISIYLLEGVNEAINFNKFWYRSSGEWNLDIYHL